MSSTNLIKDVIEFNCIKNQNTKNQNLKYEKYLPKGDSKKLFGVSVRGKMNGVEELISEISTTFFSTT